MKQVTLSDVMVALLRVTESYTGEVKIRTKVQMSKRYPGHEKIYKEATWTVTFNTQYEKRVNDGRAVEGKITDFKAMPRVWGEHLLNKNALVTYQGQLYLQVFKKAAVYERYVAIHEDGSITGVSLSEIDRYLYKSTSKSRQGLDNEVKVRNLKMESILGVSIPELGIQYSER